MLAAAWRHSALCQLSAIEWLVYWPRHSCNLYYHVGGTEPGWVIVSKCTHRCFVPGFYSIGSGRLGGELHHDNHAPRLMFLALH
jgi:hypothetical protein